MHYWRMEEIVPVYNDRPPCRACHSASGIPAAPGQRAHVNDLQCMACGYTWQESNPVHVAHAWWAAGAWESELRKAGEEPMTFADIATRSI